jgi:site-specific recombinase XerD
MRRCLLPHFGKYQAGHIVGPMVYSYTAKRLQDKIKETEKTVSHRTIEKELNYLSATCRWLYVNGMASKMPVIPKPPKAKTQPKNIQQPLTMDELALLVEKTPDDKKVLILLMSDAGLRVTEALELKVSEIDEPGGRITIRGKGGKVVIYPILTDRLKTAIKSKMEKADGEWLTINPKTAKPLGSIKTLLRLASNRAGITKHVTHHTLRHTFSVMLQESGVSTEVRRLLMRHSSLAATEHYTHVSPGYMSNQAGAFSNMINTPSESLKEK